MADQIEPLSSQILDSTTAVDSPSACTQETPEVKNNRIYISNLNFTTTEDELKELFNSHGVVSVLIPSQTIRGFRSKQLRPLGIAYADFESIEKAALAIQEFNGSIFNKRALRIKSYVPYALNNGLKNRNSVQRQSRFRFGTKRDPQANTAENEQNSIDDNQEIAEETQNPDSTVIYTSDKTNDDKKNQELSKDTLFIPRLPAKTRACDVRAFFGDYSPLSVTVFKTRHSNRFHLSSYCNACLVTLPSAVNIDDVIAVLNGQKLMGKPLTVKASFQHKIGEIRNNNHSVVEELDNSSPAVAPPLSSGNLEKDATITCAA